MEKFENRLIVLRGIVGQSGFVSSTKNYIEKSNIANARRGHKIECYEQICSYFCSVVVCVDIDKMDFIIVKIDYANNNVCVDLSEAVSYVTTTIPKLERIFKKVKKYIELSESIFGTKGL